MEQNHIHIYLKFYDFDLDPDEITKKLGLEPTEIGRKGEKYTLGRKAKTEKERTFNFWEYKEKIITGEHWHQKFINDFIDRIIEPRKGMIREITEVGESELSLVPYYYDEFNVGFDFSLQKLETLVNARIFINFDIYFLPRDDD